MNQSLFKFIKDQEAKNGDINPNIKQEYENQRKFLENSMHSLKKRLEIESQIHKADNLQIMTDNMDLIQKINTVRDNIKAEQKRKTDAENNYKQLCTKYGIKPARNLEDLEDPDWLKDNERVFGSSYQRNMSRTEDDQNLMNLRRERDHRRNHLEMLRASIEESRQEQMHLEQMLSEQ